MRNKLIRRADSANQSGKERKDAKAPRREGGLLCVIAPLRPCVNFFSLDRTERNITHILMGMSLGKGLTWILVALVGGWLQTASASNIVVTNAVLAPCIDAGQTFVQFDIKWDSSWRASWVETGVTPNITVTNWDAAWVFVKFRQSGAEDWSHASLSTNVADHYSPAGSALSVGLSTNAGGTNFGCGLFLYRSTEGGGQWTNTGVKLRWRYADDGVINTDKVDLAVLAIEMVYVPQGSFYVGDGTVADIQGQFCSNTTGTVAFRITNENYEITLGGGDEGSLGNNNTNGMSTADDFSNTVSKTLPAAFPKGYSAFYCMKYEISQGQWVSFFNMLSNSGNQKKSNDVTQGRDITGGTLNNQGKGSDGEVNRNTVSWPNAGDATCTTPNHACNFLSWADVCAYADWAGLRPMTELEFEKACRGPLNPVANEYAWGSTVITDITGFSGTDGSGTETAQPANANCNYNNNGILGPVRCGIYATASSGREASGATYWGIMEMSGNVWERTVTVGHANGRAFTGAVGDGKLDATTGNANTDYWPATSSPTGSGLRGGSCLNSAIYHRSSDRNSAAGVDGSNRYSNRGGRGVRPAP